MPDNLINPSDFDGITLSLDFSNATTGFKPTKGRNAELVQWLEKGFVLSLPQRSCAIGHQLLVEMSVQEPGKKNTLVFECTTKVEAIEKCDDFDAVTCALVQYEEKVWDDLKRIYSERQRAILEFFKAARGY